VYVVDTFNSRVEKFTSSGSFLTQFGSSGSGPGQLSGPNSVAVDSAGNVFVADSGNYRVEEFAPSGTFSSTFGSNGTGPGQVSAAYGIAVDPSGNVYVVDGANARVEAFTSSGTFQFQWPCATGACPTGTGSGQFSVPYGIAITSSGSVYVTDMENNEVEKFSITSFSSIATSSLPVATSANQTTPFQPTTPSPNSELSPDTMLLVGVIIILAVLLAVGMLRRRKPSSPSPATSAVGNVVYCEKCGAQNSADQQFCEKCGEKLVKI
jgi:sugar lactone lactonase YvrE